jgi:7,8-dihydropterin-6-yl-methyl-4-(beta-D-ribofuranosyl)aminobenzene 5'-phosphate synthase
VMLGGMLKAIRMINDAKIAKHDNKSRLVVDLHPARPDFRGMQIGEELISLEADPSFKEIEEAGAKVATNSSGHTVLDSMFLVSGKIPRETSYEVGIKNGIRFIESSKSWAKDELIMDERFLMCNVKG